MKRNNVNKFVKKILVGGLAFSMMNIGSVVPVAANDVGASIWQTIVCAGLLISNPEQHLIECGVGDYAPGRLVDTTSGGTASDNPPPKLVCDSGQHVETSASGQECVDDNVAQIIVADTD